MNVQDSLTIETIKRQIDNLNSQMESLHNLVSHSNDVIANEIAAGDRYLTLVSITLGVLGIILGIYIAWCTNKIKKMKMSMEEKERDIKRTSQIVEQTNSQIQSDISGLYDKLRREETKTFLNRLIEVPEDIANIIDLLLFRNLDSNDYNLLKQAFDKLPKEDSRNTEYYLLLFFQHFAGRSLSDADLRSRFIADFDSLILAAFKNDIIKSTKDMMTVIKDMPNEEKLQILEPYYKALKRSKFKDNSNLFDSIKSVLTNEQWQELSKDGDEGQEGGEQ